MMKEDVSVSLNDKVKRTARSKKVSPTCIELSKPYEIAIWMVNETALTFDQIGRFCKLHPMHVSAIADGTLGKNLIGCSPVGKYITQQEIKRCESDPTAQLVLMSQVVSALNIKPPKRRKYVSVVQRRSKPDAILWLINFHSLLSDRQIGKLVGSTVETVASIRNGTHRSMSSLLPKDPVLLGLCTQQKLDEAVRKARAAMNKENVEEN
jgi:uncharacterized protein